MIETLLTGLILAFISGTAIFALKHKKAFDKIVWKFIYLLFFIYFVLSLWISALSLSFSRLSKIYPKII
jgi:hypothetical protein